MTKTESTLICSELRKIDMDLDMLKAKLMTLSQDIQGSASLYGRKSKIKGPKAVTHDTQVRSTGSATREKEAQVGTD